MTRLTSLAALICGGAITTFAAPAFAQSQAEIAARHNEEGKELMYANKYPEATAKFREAVARVPEPKYFFNLCTSLFQEGRFGEALTACNAVDKNSPSPEQRAKADKLTQRIMDEAKNQGVPLEPVGGGTSPTDECARNPNDPACRSATPPPDVCLGNPQDPSCAGATPPSQYRVGRPPSGTGVFAATTPDNKYTWTLGAELFAGGGQVGRKEYYGTANAGLRIKGDYLLNGPGRLGAQGYLQISHFGKGEMDTTAVDTLDIFDLGIALYKHLCLPGADRLCLTPLAGVQLAMMSPAGDNDGAGSQVFNYAAVGGRAEIGAHYAFGRRYEYVIGAAVGVNAYSRVFSGPSDDGFDDSLTVEEVGLDKGGIAAYLGVGFTYRFNTPLGSSPFVTLE